jgi:Flp pilus assembly protein TadG
MAHRSKAHRDRGAALLEMALVLPILLMLLMGIIEFGRAYNTLVSIQSAAREGARELALRHPGNVDSAVRNAAPSVDIDSITTVPCPATGDGVARVTVSEDFTFGIPFVPLGTRTLTATSQMRCGL